jgi:hypothetical protein
MVLEMLGRGYRAEARPFGATESEIPPSQDPRLGWLALGRWWIEQLWQALMGWGSRKCGAKPETSSKEE